jgi:hypothetical protein
MATGLVRSEIRRACSRLVDDWPDYMRCVPARRSGFHPCKRLTLLRRNDIDSLYHAPVALAVSVRDARPRYVNICEAPCRPSGACNSVHGRRPATTESTPERERQSPKWYACPPTGGALW